jgi:hypothetical protein
VPDDRLIAARPGVRASDEVPAGGSAAEISAWGAWFGTGSRSRAQLVGAVAPGALQPAVPGIVYCPSAAPWWWSRAARRAPRRQVCHGRPAHWRRTHPRRRAQQRPIDPGQPSLLAVQLPFENRDLVSQREDLGVLVTVAHWQQPKQRDRVDHAEVGQSKQHGWPCLHQPDPTNRKTLRRHHRRRRARPGGHVALPGERERLGQVARRAGARSYCQTSPNGASRNTRRLPSGDQSAPIGAPHSAARRRAGGWWPAHGRPATRPQDAGRHTGWRIRVVAPARRFSSRRTCRASR